MNEERRPLLVKDDDKPFPKFQMALLCFTRMFDVMTFLFIFPFVNRFIEDTGVPVPEVGFWSGFIESAMSPVQALILPQWGRYSDSHGRKPILLISLVGSALACGSFGFSTNVWQMLVLRVAGGFFNGSVVTIRLMVGEAASPADQARAYSWFAIGSQMALLIGPLIGGGLVRPIDRWPLLRPVKLLADYPYALPGLCLGGLALANAAVNAALLKETRPAHASADSKASMSTKEIVKSPGVMRVLTVYVGANTLSYVYSAGKTLFYYLPTEVGGTGLNPSEISYLFSCHGILQLFWVGLFYQSLIAKFGSAKLLTYLGPLWAVASLLYPLLNLTLRLGGGRKLFWIQAVLTEVVSSALGMSFATAQLELNLVTPSPATMGALNGLALALSIAMRSFVPALTTSLFSLSIKYHIFWGYLAWVFLFFSSILFAICTRKLPSLQPRPVEAESNEVVDH